MLDVLFNEMRGLDLSKVQVEAPELSFLKFCNYIPNRQIGGIVPRGGSVSFDATGDIFLLSGYARETSSPQIPLADVPIRLRRDGATNYIEKFDWSMATWSAVTQGIGASFDDGVVGSTAQIDELLAVASGKPSQIRDISSGKIFSLGGAAPAAAATAASAGAGALTGDYQWVYTYYDSTTGWESSPSAVSNSLTLSSEDVNLSGLSTSSPREGVDQKRIYRTLTTGELPYFLSGTIALATTTYLDDVVDGSLGQQAPTLGDHNPPPSTSYIAEAYGNRLFLADGDTLYHSQAYDGSLNRLEYFSENRTERFNARITGLKAAPELGGLLIFKPPGFGIDILRGRSEEDFNIEVFLEGEGTNSHNSISLANNFLTYWGGTGPRLVRGGQLVPNIDQQLGNFLRPYIELDFNQDMYIWSIWSPAERMFIYGFGATCLEGGTWEEVNSGLVVQWEDAQTGQLIDWSSGSGASAGTSRQVVFGFDPNVFIDSFSVFMAQFDWPTYVADGNIEQKLFTCAYAPKAKSSLLSAFQSSFFMGTQNLDKTIQTFRTDLTMDDSIKVEAQGITSRIDAAQKAGGNAEAKEHIYLDFTHINPYERETTVDFSVEAERPHTESIVWQPLFWESGRSMAYFPSGLARWVHLRFTSSGAFPGRPVIGPFSLGVILLAQRDDSETG